MCLPYLGNVLETGFGRYQSGKHPIVACTSRCIAGSGTAACREGSRYLELLRCARSGWSLRHTATPSFPAAWGRRGGTRYSAIYPQTAVEANQSCKGESLVLVLVQPQPPTPFGLDRDPTKSAPFTCPPQPYYSSLLYALYSCRPLPYLFASRLPTVIPTSTDAISIRRLLCDLVLDYAPTRADIFSAVSHGVTILISPRVPTDQDCAQPASPSCRPPLLSTPACVSVSAPHRLGHDHGHGLAMTTLLNNPPDSGPPPRQIRFVHNQGQPPSKRRRINAAYVLLGLLSPCFVCLAASPLVANGCPRQISARWREHQHHAVTSEAISM